MHQKISINNTKVAFNSNLYIRNTRSPADTGTFWCRSMLKLAFLEQLAKHRKNIAEKNILYKQTNNPKQLFLSKRKQKNNPSCSNIATFIRRFTWPAFCSLQPQADSRVKNMKCSDKWTSTTLLFWLCRNEVIPATAFNKALPVRHSQNRPSVLI